MTIKVISFEEKDRWHLEGSLVFQRTLATLAAAERAADRGPAALLAASDQLASSATEARLWMSDHPSPGGELDDRLRRTLRSTRILARLFELEAAGQGGPNLEVIGREIDGLVGMIATTVAALDDRRRH